jgi:YVTN family beta-propeller protein
MKLRLACVVVSLFLTLGSTFAANLYVANTLSGTVSIIDTASNSVIATSGLPWGGPSRIIFLPDGTRGYVTNSFSASVSVIDTTTFGVIALIGVGNFPQGLAITPDGAFIYVANLDSGTVSVISTTSNAVVATLELGGGPQGVAITPDGTRVYVTNQTFDSVSLIDIATNTVIATVMVGDFPIELAITPDGSFVYVATAGSGVSVIDTTSNTVVAAVEVAVAHAVAISPDGTRAYVTSQLNSVAVIDTATNTVVASVPVADNPHGVATHPGGTYVYATNLFSGSVSVIDAASNSVLATIEVGSFPFGIAIAPPVAIIGVVIDIKPGSSPNTVTLGSHGVIPVAILSSIDFDAAQVDPATIRLAGAAVSLKAKGTKYSCTANDVNSDGLEDLMCHVETDQLTLQAGETAAVLEAMTFAGRKIRGEDSVRIVP